MPKKLRSVVLIDDNETTIFLNNRLLTRLEVADNVLTFSRAEQAFDALWGTETTGAPAHGVPELVFVDLKMPGMDGFEFLQRFNELPEPVRQQTVLTVLTTSMHAADTARVAQYPNIEYLSKPLTEEKMSKLLQKRF
ncbi:response regulator [Hymenobacter yonginensis]|uniref:Response regulator n=1 Tax=Hymenobacter yonginensis TaxID=748197 RepID=A0ABY7PNG3_9BACT|nr:response regulator [Hymenobacter yonginensis]WBO84798.1 response regulator [Hymenobacter yonginensis]